MDFDAKWAACVAFFNELSGLLSETHETIGSCNHDNSVYLVPNGTSDQITYYGKPRKSFRMSDHWSWYSNLKKCDKEHYIQCLSVDLPYANKRPSPGKPSKPIFGIQVCILGNDRKYHCVFGEKYDRKTKKWTWINANPIEVVGLLH